MSKIEDQQLATKLLELLPQVSRTMAGGIRTHPDPIALNQLMVLRTLEERPSNLSDLAKEHIVSLPAMSNTISRMVKQGWVTRTRSQEDRRMILIELTDSGQKRISSIFQHLANHLTALFDNLSPQEKAELTRGLSLVETIFTSVGGRER